MNGTRYFFQWFPFSYTGSTSVSGFMYYPLTYQLPATKVVPVAPKPAPNPYAVDPDQRHLARIRRELEASWTPPTSRR